MSNSEVYAAMIYQSMIIIVFYVYCDTENDLKSVSTGNEWLDANKLKERLCK